MYPSRIICGSKTNKARFFLNLLKDSAIKKNIQTQITSSSEAEAIKLFSNMYLAMRIAFFNELDSFSLSKNLHSKEIIDGLSSDPRIGNYYNNPSFGYGGYCLPKDTQQLRQNFKDIPQKLIQATIQSNHLRKKFIVNEILKRKAKIIGIYRLSMKTGSDNWRESAIIDVIKSLKREQNQLIIYEPLLSKKTFMGISVEKDLEKFKNKSKLIVANRFDGALSDNDEIPNFDSKYFKEVKNNIFIFKQLFFYYKFNLFYDRIPWFGSKACKKKNLKSFSWLRNLKNKKYPIWRIDSYFSNLKQRNVSIVEDGGWHFTNLKTPEEIFIKLSNYGHHNEFEDAKITLEDIKKNINNRIVDYDHTLDKSQTNKLNNGYKLKIINDTILPKYLVKNKELYKKWFEKD